VKLNGRIKSQMSLVIKNISIWRSERTIRLTSPGWQSIFFSFWISNLNKLKRHHFKLSHETHYEEQHINGNCTGCAIVHQVIW
jgi:hypothetical protein